MKNVIALWNKQRLYIENLWLYQRFINKKIFKKIVENFKNGWKMLYKAGWLLYYMQVFKRNYFSARSKTLIIFPLIIYFFKGQFARLLRGLLFAWLKTKQKAGFLEKLSEKFSLLFPQAPSAPAPFTSLKGAFLKYWSSASRRLIIYSLPCSGNCLISHALNRVIIIKTKRRRRYDSNY